MMRSVTAADDPRWAACGSPRVVDSRRRIVKIRLMSSPAWRALARVLRAVATGVLALVILFEEWGWEPLQRLAARLFRLPLLRRIEAAIAALPPGAALAAFLVPTLMLLPVKLAALWLIGHGHALLGALSIVGAKLFGTALVARLFTLTRPALLRMAWFARLYAGWTGWKDALLERVRASAPWRAGRAMRRLLRQRWARWRAALFGT